MTTYISTYPDIALRDQSITERVFAGLENRPDNTILTDGPTGRRITAAAFTEQVNHDRLKELIKYKGFQVAPAESETKLVATDRITDPEGGRHQGLSERTTGALPTSAFYR